MWGRICSGLLCLALCTGMLSVPAMASEAKRYDSIMTTEAEIYVGDEMEDGIESVGEITEAEGREIQAYDEDGNIILHENESVQELSELVLRGGVTGLRIMLGLGMAR